MRQRVTQTKTAVRWVRSHAEVADGLTKSSVEAMRRLARFFLQAGYSRIVEYSEFESARKRKSRDLRILEYDAEKGPTEKTTAGLERAVKLLWAHG